jgi:Ca2+-binding RTX toxin-like protein
MSTQVGRIHGRKRFGPLASAIGGAAAILTLSMVGIAPVASAAAQGCAEQPATIVGTAGDDVIDGTAGDDVIVGLAGDDLIRGRGGSDVICAGKGDDVVRGSRAGGDIYGDAGNDTLFSRGGAGLNGGRGNDTLDASADGSADLVPGSGDDLVIGCAAEFTFDEVQYGFDATRPIHANLITGIATGQGTDTLVNVDAVVGGAYDDTLVGNGGSNALVGREGNDTLIGNGGDDTLAGEQGDDSFQGGPGSDTADYYDQNYADGFPWGPMNVNLRTGIATGDGNDTLSSIENASGSDGADTMIGTRRDNVFFLLLAGNDIVRMGGGNDWVGPGSGANDLAGGAGRDLVYYGGGRDPDHRHRAVTVDLGAGTSSSGDSLRGFELVWGSIHDDTLIGDGGPNRLYGDSGDDVLRGLAGADRLLGQRGADEANGGAGIDRCRAEIEVGCELPSPAATDRGSALWRAIQAELRSTLRNSV